MFIRSMDNLHLRDLHGIYGMNPSLLVLNPLLFNLKPPMARGLIFSPNMFYLHQFLKGYTSLMVFE